jgi:hypothetical protein
MNPIVQRDEWWRERRALLKKDPDVAGAPLKRIPSPWDANHPRADLLRMNSFQIRFREKLPG